MPFRLPGRFLSLARSAPIVDCLEPTAAHDVEVEHSHEALAPELSAPDHRRPVERFAAGIGNQNFGSVIARMRAGDGIGPGGVVDERVRVAIDAAHSNQRLDSNVAQLLEGSFGSLDHVRVHTGPEAAALARSVDARAFVKDHKNIFFGDGEYQPHTHAGRELIAHEVAHLGQQEAMARANPVPDTMVVSQESDDMERRARDAARKALG
jgi:hypothetical protein